LLSPAKQLSKRGLCDMLQVNVLLSLIFTTGRIYTSHPSTDSKTTHILFTPPVNIYTTHCPSSPSLFTSPTLIYVVVVGGLTGLGIGTGENTAVPPELAPHLTNSECIQNSRNPPVGLGGRPPGKPGNPPVGKGTPLGNGGRGPAASDLRISC
jgi:hypothetical protein